MAGDASEPDHVDLVTATAVDDDGSSDTASDDASVAFNDAEPTISIVKDASPDSLDEPGGTVTFGLTITNPSAESLVLDSLVDSVFGDLLDGSNPGVSSNSCVSLPASLAGGAAFGCSFEAVVAGNASGADHSDTVTITAHDDEGGVATDESTAVVGFDDVAPAIAVNKEASAATITEPGDRVTFGVTVENLSVEPVTMTALVDDVFGDLLDAGNTAVVSNTCPAQPAVVAVGESFACSFAADLAGLFGDPDHVDTVTATLADDDGNVVEESDGATVSFTPAGSSVGGVVFVDTDRDGVMDAGEAGLAAVGLVITDSGGGGSITVTTDGHGAWSAAVLPGAVSVAVDASTVPADLDLTTANAFQSVTAVAGESVAADDIGYAPPTGSIAGLVYLDLDHDPDRDPGEPPLAGVVVDLLDGGVVVATTTTASDGSYRFDHLVPATYAVRVDGGTVIAGVEISVDPDGTLDEETDADVAPGAEVVGLDFGYSGTAFVGDTVWADEDGDGVQDEGEGPIADATVTLTWAGLDGVFGNDDDYEYPSLQTDDAGEYGFAGLPPGTFRLEVDGSTVGSAMSATTPTIITTVLEPGASMRTADFGFAGDEALPYTGIAADRFLLAAAVLLLIGGAVLADGHRRDREWDLAIWRVDGRR